MRHRRMMDRWRTPETNPSRHRHGQRVRYEMARTLPSPQCRNILIIRGALSNGAKRHRYQILDLVDERTADIARQRVWYDHVQFLVQFPDHHYKLRVTVGLG